MTKQINQETLPNWDLSDFYPAINSKEIETDFRKATDLTSKFVHNYQNKLLEIINQNPNQIAANQLVVAIKEYEIISEILGKISSFAYLNYCTNLDKAEFTAFYQNVSEKINQIASQLVFFELELNQIEEKRLETLIEASNQLKFYQPYIRDIGVFKPYQLSNQLEKLLLEKSATSSSAWSRLFDETINGLEFIFDKKTLNCSEIFNLLCHKDEKIRKKAAKIIGEVLQKNGKILAYITNILAKDKAISDEWRGFASPISSRNLSNFIEDNVVQSLVDTVKQNYSATSHRYYKIHKALHKP